MSNLTQQQKDALGIKTIIKKTKASTKNNVSREKELKQIMYNACYNALKNEPEFVELNNETIYKVNNEGEASDINANGVYLANYDGVRFNILDIKIYTSHLRAFDLRNPKCVKMVAQHKAQNK